MDASPEADAAQALVPIADSSDVVFGERQYNESAAVRGY
jgi:hypothetical protein